MSKLISDLLQVVAYVGGPLLLGLVFIYGIRATRRRDNSPAMREVTDRATKDIYDQNDIERERREKAAEKSGKVIDVIERKSGTTG